MAIKAAPIHATSEKRCGWFVDFYNQWPAVLKPRTANWQDFNLTVFEIAGENSPYKRSWEISLGLLGFNVVVTYVRRDSDDSDGSPR